MGECSSLIVKILQSRKINSVGKTQSFLGIKHVCVAKTHKAIILVSRYYFM
jgi:hypothetical protein